MKRKTAFILTGTLLACAPATAQTPYMNENYMPTDLIGSARYVGMGGALGALGADISAASSNPAALGLYRKSDAALTFSVLTQKEKPDLNADMTHVSFDQAGFVVSVPMMSRGLKHINFGFNYQKKANFNQSFIADNFSLGGLSQTQQMADILNNTGYSTPLADLMYKAFLVNPSEYETDNQGNVKVDEDGNPVVKSYDALKANSNRYDRTTEGHIAGYDFNVSANVNDRLYLGFTLGVNDVDYYSYSTYSEVGTVTDGDGNTNDDFKNYFLYNTQHVSGYGINAKFGAIFRPVENSPFRIGLAIETPTFYHLEYYSSYSINSPMKENEESHEIEVGEYRQYVPDYELDNLQMKIRTPWKFRVSLGHTVGTFLALGAEYEYADYSKTKQGYEEEYYDGLFGEWYYDDYESDHEMDKLHKATLRGTHSFKFGGELNLTETLAFRFGYNYYSPMFKEEARLDQTVNSPAYNYLSTTDFMNKGDVNIFTLGLGYHGKHFYGDVAYKYRQQSGDFYAFDDTYIGGGLSPVDVNLDTHQVFFTLGYKF